MKLGNVAVLVMLGLCSGMAQAQQPIDRMPLDNQSVPNPGATVIVEPRINLSLTVLQAQLMVETLGQIGCQNVQQMLTCNRAAELLRDIQRQVREQQK